LALIALSLAQLDLSSSITVLARLSTNTVLDALTTVSGELTSGAVLTLVGGLVVLLVAITLWSNNWSRATVGISIESLSNVARLALIALSLAQLDLSSLVTVLSGSSANSILSGTTISG
jgi:hypothetical protein